MDKKSKSSKTADLTLAARAWAVRYRENPVFHDSIAFDLCNNFWYRVLSSRLLTWLVVEKQLGYLLPIVSAILMRAKFSEIEVERAVESGVEQFVIIGAGFDTFAMRRQDLADKLTVYEIDHPATQAEKRRRMKLRGFPEPENTRYIPLDLNKELLIDGLFRAGFNFSEIAIFSWLGVTFYLPMKSITRTLKSISKDMAPGSQVIFDYVGKLNDTPEKWQKLHMDCDAYVAKKGERWISSFSADELPEFLEELGFTDVYNLRPKDVGEALYTAAPDDYPGVFGICRASTSSE